LEPAALSPDRPQGLTAEAVGELLQIDRSNASRDLNALVGQRQAIKIGGKPVLFLSYDVVLQTCSRSDAHGHEFLNWSQFVNAFAERGLTSPAIAVSGKRGRMPVASVFERLPGHDASLKQPIELAKAAILYPSDGLHTLLTGPTGVGKTLFAETMHAFALETEQVAPEAPFVAFNCADYANNPHLLLAHLFGVEKGAYTGADRDRAGLVEKADGGVLFLDEVHRLPPEGQEMLFALLDRGVFRRLGESDTLRRAKIRLVAATTESVQSALLMTFLRRIPMQIPIPSLAERTLEERFRLVEYLFAEESARVQRTFWVAPSVLKALLLFDCPGNVGQLRSEIQLLSARAFLAQIQNGDPNTLQMTLQHASDAVRTGGLAQSRHRLEVEELLSRYPTGLVLNGENAAVVRRDEESLYVMLESQALELRQRGMDEEGINRVLSAEIDVYFRKFLRRVSKQFETRRQDIARIVEEPFLTVIEEMFELASDKLRLPFASQAVFGTALHLRVAVDRLAAGQHLVNPSVENLRAQATAEYAAAEAMALLFAERTGVSLPESEVGFLTTILLSTYDSDPVPRVGVLVVAHGQTTASSMLETVHSLLGTTHGKAVDFPLDMEWESMVEQVVADASKIEEGKGLLLLVDLVSLLPLAEEIRRQTSSEVAAMANVNTRMLMEAVRKAAMSTASLPALQECLLQAGRLFWREAAVSGRPPRHVLLPVVCVTGEGAAMQLKAFLETRLQVPDEVRLEVKNVSFSSFKETPERLIELMRETEVPAIVGTIDPQVEGVPFLSAQEVLVGDGLRRLGHLIGSQWTAESASGGERETDVWESLQQTLRETVKRVNPYFAVPSILRALDQLENALGHAIDLDTRIGVTMHLVLAVERRMTEGVWPKQQKTPLELEYPEWLPLAEEAFKSFAREAGVSLPEAELCHLLMLVQHARAMESEVS
ncbi:MAG: sigma 54-interacting transcriptional regulator, partial [Tumebacillaceae bacterium]